MKNIICPVSFQKIPSHLPRITALYTVIGAITYIQTDWLLLLLWLVFDFAARASNQSELSLIHHMALKTSQFLGLKSKPIDKAPKLFAARLGTIMFFAATALHISGFTKMATIIVLLVGLLASLEWLFNFCAGCYIYHAMVFPFFSKK